MNTFIQEAMKYMMLQECRDNAQELGDEVEIQL